MPMTIDGESQAGPWYKRIAWFVGLWLASVLVVGTIAYLIRWWIV